MCSIFFTLHALCTFAIDNKTTDRQAPGAGLHLSCIVQTYMHVYIQDTPQEACLAALTRLTTLSLVRPPNEHTEFPTPIIGFGDRLSTLSSMSSLQVGSAAVCAPDHHCCDCVW